ncbi:hypothetical protein ES705_05435 [subsurface metagenome]
MLNYLIRHKYNVIICIKPINLFVTNNYKLKKPKTKMRNNKKKISYLLIILICVLFYMQIGLKINTLTSHHQNMSPILIAESIGHISIDGNNELASHPNVKGFGTWKQPYIIENYEIGGSGNVGINITNTNKPLIIYNCTIENFNYGIWLQNISNVKIYNNTIDGIDGIAGGTGGLGKHGDIGAGIYLTSSSNNSLTGNTIVNITGGIGERYIEGGNGGIGAGIYLIESFNNSLTDNTIMEIDGGMGGDGFMYFDWWGYGGDGNIGAGIYFMDSSYNSLNSNIITNIRGGNGGDANYYYGGDGGIGAGIYFMDSSYNSLKSNNIDIIEGGTGGASMFGGDGDKGMGIHLTSSSNNNLINNSINQVSGGNAGLGFTDDYVNRDGRSDYGFGIYLSLSSINKLTGNIIVETIGGYARTSIPRYKTGYGIRIYSGSNNNSMYLNSFIDNTINAYNSGLDNKWDNGSIGNFWDDYQGSDINDDGIGDSPYYFSSNSRDNYPIWDDGDDLSPSIQIVFPISDEVFGSEAPAFNVHSPDLDIDTMWYSLNDGRNITFTSNGSIDQTEWDSLSDGTVTIMFYANDTAGNIGFEIVNIIKDTATLNGRNEIPSFPFLIFIPIITLTLIVSMLFIIKKVDFQ